MAHSTGAGGTRKRQQSARCAHRCGTSQHTPTLDTPQRTRDSARQRLSLFLAARPSRTRPDPTASALPGRSCMHIHMCVYAYMYMYIDIVMYIYIYMYVYVYVYRRCVCRYIYVYTYIYVYIDIVYIFVSMYIHVCMYVHVYVYTYICMYAYMYVYTYMLTNLPGQNVSRTCGTVCMGCLRLVG